MNKVRIAMIAVDLGRTGISTVILNYCKNIDLSRFEIELIVGDKIVPEYREICNKLGIKIIEVPFKHEDAKRYYIQLYKALRKKKYDIAHIHGNSAMITPELYITWLSGIKTRIVHCHNSTCDHPFLDKLFRPILKKLYTYGFACSTLAGKWLFGDRKFCVIPNGFNTEKFIYSQSTRELIRKKLNIEDKFVVGHIGQFNDQKNHKFLLEVFKEVVCFNDKAILLLVGGGPDKDEICRIIEKHPYSDRIIVYGESDKPEDLYNAMDVFVFPSKYEGLGIVLLEAQINGLYCISSDAVPPEAIITDNVKILSLNEPKKKWAECIVNSRLILRNNVYEENRSKIDSYNISLNARELEDIYLKSIKYEEKD